MRELIQRKSAGMFAFVFFASLFVLFWPLAASESKILYLDKFVHSGLFFVLSFFGLVAYRRYVKGFLAILIIYAVASEIIQELFISGRGFDSYDIIADIIGILLAYLLIKKTLV
ncbi:MAG: VanZ family protein [Patescibacteria group bacterium]|jgi:VanZ family protein